MLAWKKHSAEKRKVSPSTVRVSSVERRAAVGSNTLPTSPTTARYSRASLRTIPPRELRRPGERHRRGELNFGNAAQAVGDHVFLGLELVRVAQLLEVAAAADPKIGAARFNPSRRRLDDLLDHSPGD